jgi:predicted kinase
VLDKDIVKDALMRGANLDTLEAGPPAYDVYWAVARSIVEQGYSLILDNPAYWPLVQERSRLIADGAGAAYVMIECVCQDRDMLIKRLAMRDALLSQPREPYRFDVVDGIVEPACERLVLDTTRPLHEIVEEAMAYIESGVTA